MREFESKSCQIIRCVNGAQPAYSSLDLGRDEKRPGLDIYLQLRPWHVISALACLAVVLSVTKTMNHSMSARLTYHAKWKHHRKNLAE